MTHRAEQIMAAITAKLTGLTTTRSNVFRSRSYPFAEDQLPALAIYQGPDEPLDEYGARSFGLIDSALEITVAINIKGQEEGLDTELNKIRREVHVALMADYQQGLDFVIQTIPQGAGDVSISSDSELATSTLETSWEIHYRSSTLDPGA